MSKTLRKAVYRIGGGAAGSPKRNLSRGEARKAFESLLAGEGTDSQIAAYFTLIRAKGATSDELTGSAEVARERIVFPELPDDAVVISTSRLGRSLAPPLGLAIAATGAACGATVLLQAAPHARGAGVTLGDLWERLVGPIPGESGSLAERLMLHGLGCWTPTRADPAWERLLRIEEEIGLRGLPDIITKLLAPSGCRLMVAAVAGPVLGTAGDALASLGHTNAMIVQGMEGSIDPSVCARTRGLLLEQGSTFPLRLQPADFALEYFQEPANPEGCDPLEAAATASLEVLMGSEGPLLNATLLGAGLVLQLAGKTRDLAGAVALAREAVESGEAHRRIQAVQGP